MHLSNSTRRNTTSGMAQAIQRFAAFKKISFSTPVDLKDQIYSLVKLVST